MVQWLTALVLRDVLRFHTDEAASILETTPQSVKAFARTILSHGVAELPPNELDLGARTLVTTLAVRGGARTVRMTGADGVIRIELVSERAGGRQADAIATTVRRMFRLDQDLTEFYAIVRDDPELSWCALGAGRMLQGPTVFEDVVK